MRSEVLLHTAADVVGVSSAAAEHVPASDNSEKRSEGSALASLIERNRDQGRFCDDDWIDGRLLELAGQ